LTFLLIGLSTLASAQGDVHQVSIEPLAGETFTQAKYFLYIPPGVERVERIILHQHGCGDPAQEAGRYVTEDVHWKLLADTIGSALLGSSLWPMDECRDWCDPANGTNRAYLLALDSLAAISGHPEVATVDWIIWGHSGGGYWAGEMLARHPDRFAAVVFQSGGPRLNDYSEDSEEGAIYPTDVPMLIHTGIGEKDDERFADTYAHAIAFFAFMRRREAPATLAIDPASGHDAGQSRYLTIPWIEAVVRQPASAATVWPSEYSEAGMWYPSQTVAAKWDIFTQVGTVPDYSPPVSPPFNLVATPTPEGVRLTWDARPDYESGLQTFRIYRDGELQPPYTGAGRHQPTTHIFREVRGSDTPKTPIQEMEYLDRTARAGSTYTYRISVVSYAGLESPPSAPLQITVE
jgi:pimeloyl-ACP methyl ester carboxylesterase